jgi:hypothetical protein
LAVLERHGPTGADIKFLDDDVVYLIGRNASNDLVIDGDDTISGTHAELRRGSSAWLIEDLGSTNGTHVNGERIVTKRALHDGDEILVGRTRLRMVDRSARAEGTTRPIHPPPQRTPREQDVLVELCRPVMSGRTFTPPAKVEMIANRLVVTEAAVRQHLGNLYGKFAIHEGDDKRVLLANAAIESGAVTWKDFE